MGAIYKIACKDCKVVRDLDKLHLESVHNREEALAYSASLVEKPQLFREALLMSFMGDHANHECVLFNDSADDPELSVGYAYDHDFWRKQGER